MLKIYKASAGSGKTFTLAKEYIRLLLGTKSDDGNFTLNPNPVNTHRAILAITFTNKATDEMKRRIVHELAVLAGAEPGWKKESPYAGELMSEFRCSRDELRNSSRLALHRLLFDFNFFHVSTIDAFFQTILRTFAREAELTGNYELQLKGEDMVAEGVGRLITSLSTNPDTKETREVTQAIIDFMLEKLEDASSGNVLDKSGSVYGQLLSTLERLNDEVLALNLDAFSRYISDPRKIRDFDAALKKWRDSVRDTAATVCGESLAIIGSFGDDFVKKNFVSHFLNAITKESQGVAAPQTTIDKVLDSDGEEGVLSVLKKGRFRTEGGNAAINDAVLKAALAVRERATTDATVDAIRKNIFAMGLMRRVTEKMEEYRTENNALLISDTNSLLQSIIGDDDAPFVYERMGVWFDHFLIDEFQDTSRMQWNNLRPLVGEGIAAGNDSLIIGDEKQCIYRFRNSDPTLLGHTVAKNFAGSVTTIGAGEASNSNWRSSQEVVAFNNDLFEAMAANNGMSGIYANVKQVIKRTDRKGYVKITRIDNSESDFEEQSLKLLAEDIKRQLDDGYQPADIAVLTRTNIEGQKVIDFLLELQATQPDFPRFGIISDDAMSLNSSPVVKIIVSALRTYATNDTAEEKNYYSSSRLDQMISRFESGIGHGMQPSEALRSAIDSTPERAPSVSHHRAWSLISLVESIIGSEVPETMWTTQNGFVSAFMDVVQDFCSRNTAADIHGLLKWWDDHGKDCKVSAPADTTAIRVMTIHKSKGLEFPCVHLPMVAKEVVKFKNSEWVSSDGLNLPGINPDCIPPLLLINPGKTLEKGVFGPYVRQRTDEQILDELNTLYVGFTRAIYELCVHYTVTVTKKGDSESLTEGKLVNDAMRTAFGLSLSPGTEYVAGAPTTPIFEEKKTTALDPHLTERMDSFYTIQRDDLWKGIEVSADDNS